MLSQRYGLYAIRKSGLCVPRCSRRAGRWSWLLLRQSVYRAYWSSGSQGPYLIDDQCPLAVAKQLLHQHVLEGELRPHIRVVTDTLEHTNTGLVELKELA